MIVSFSDRCVALRYPADWEHDIQCLFGAAATAAGNPHSVLVVEEEGDGRFAIHGGRNPAVSGLGREDALIQLLDQVTSELAAQITSCVALHAGAVGWNGRSVLIPGQTGAGKSSLVAWLVARGFRYLTDELAALSHAGICGFNRALMLKPGADERMGALAAFSNGDTLRVAGNLLVVLAGATAGQRETLACGLIVFTAFRRGAALSIEPLSAARTCMQLMACNVNAENFADGGLRTISALAKRTPAVLLHYGSFDQIDGILDTLAKHALEGDGEGVGGYLSTLAPPPTASPVPSPGVAAPAIKAAAPKLTIGMATYDDYDGVYFSVQALRMYHPEIRDLAEFIVIDNHPDGPCSQPLKSLQNNIRNYRYIPEAKLSGTFVKGRVFEEAEGQFVLCMDCHVFVVPGALRRLLTYLEDHPDTSDLLQGPLIYDDMVNIATHFRPEWSGGMYGVWDNNGCAADTEAAPFEIQMQGMGLFACRRAAWPGFNPSFRGFGGEEFYIHEKFRRHGGRTLCLPFLRWMHRFNRPMGVPYRNVYEDRIWNYLVGFHELGLPTSEMETHFRTLIGEPLAGEIFAQLRKELSEL